MSNGVKKILIILGIILLIIIIGFLGFYLFKKSRVEVGEKIPVVSQIPAECKEFEGAERDMCISKIAVSSNDSFLCDRIKDEDKKNNCKAQVTCDVKFCEGISDTKLKDSCFSYLAFVLDDVLLCDKISDQDGVNLCKAVVKGNPELCKNLKEGNKNGCYTFIAGTRKDSLICDKIVDEKAKERCKANIGKGVYKNLLSKREETGREERSLIKSATEENDSSICADKIHSTEMQGACYTEIAANTKDIKFCANILVDRIRNWCYIRLALLLNNVSVCDKISNSDALVLCRALTLKNSLLCENSKMRDQCYLLSAGVLNDISICGEITSPFFKAKCLKEVFKK